MPIRIEEQILHAESHKWDEENHPLATGDCIECEAILATLRRSVLLERLFAICKTATRRDTGSTFGRVMNVEELDAVMAELNKEEGR